MSEFLFCGGPWHGQVRDVPDTRAFTVVEGASGTGFEEDLPDSSTYTKRGVYLDFDDVRCVRQVFIYDKEGLQMRRVFDAILRAYFRAGTHHTLPPTDPFPFTLANLRPATPFDGPPGVQRAN